MLSGALQKNSGVSSTVDSRLTADFWMNTRPMRQAICLRDRPTSPVAASVSGRSLVLSTISITRSSYTLSLADWARAWEMDSLMRWSLCRR